MGRMGLMGRMGRKLRDTIVCLMALFLISAVSGCGGPQQQFADKALDTIGTIPAAMTKTTELLGHKIADEGLLERWLAKASANIDDPTLYIETSFAIRSSFGLDGANARIDVDAGGDATRLPNGVRDSILDAMKGMDSSDPRWQQLFQLLAQDRLGKDAGGAGAGGSGG